MIRALLIGLGLAGLAGVGALAFSAAVDARVRKVRDELFVLGPDCEWIRFRSDDDDERSTNPEDFQAQLDQFADYWLRPTIKDAWKAGKWRVDDVAAYVLGELFPECDWPPPMSSVSLYVVWLTFRMWIANEVECDPLSTPPSGMICVDDNGTLVLAREA